MAFDLKLILIYYSLSLQFYFIFILVTCNISIMIKSPINIKFHYIDDVLSINNSMFGDFVHHINPIELEIKETTDTGRSASYISRGG